MYHPELGPIGTCINQQRVDSVPSPEKVFFVFARIRLNPLSSWILYPDCVSEIVSRQDHGRLQVHISTHKLFIALARITLRNACLVCGGGGADVRLDARARERGSSCGSHEGWPAAIRVFSDGGVNGAGESDQGNAFHAGAGWVIQMSATWGTGQEPKCRRISPHSGPHQRNSCDLDNVL